MTRNLKALGLALVGCLAFAAFSASSASAQTVPIAHFTCSEYPCEATGDQVGNHKFETGGGVVTCETAHFNGRPIEGATTSLSVDPEYKDCTLNNNLLGTSTPVTVNMNGCYYTFTVHDEGTVGEEPEADKWNGDVHIECEGGNQIEITSYKDVETHEEQHCKYKVTSETVKDIDYAVETGGDGHIRVDATNSEVDLTKVRGGLFACGPENQTAEYDGDTTVESLNQAEEPIQGNIANVET